MRLMPPRPGTAPQSWAADPRTGAMGQSGPEETGLGLAGKAAALPQHRSPGGAGGEGQFWEPAVAEDNPRAEKGIRPAGGRRD